MAILTMKLTFDYKPKDVFWCTADIGWVTGHSYITYGPLAVGATEVVFEGVPSHPDSGRFWKMIQDHKVTIFYTARTAIRALIKSGELPTNTIFPALRILGTWASRSTRGLDLVLPDVGQSRCPIVDTWWQTETGAHDFPLPGVTPLKPGSCQLPIPGIMVDIVDEAGNPVEKGHGGILVVKRRGHR